MLHQAIHSAYPSFVPSRSTIGPETPFITVYASMKANTTREYATLLIRSADYDAVMAIWQSADGVTIRDVDAREPLTAYLEQHRGLCFVAVEDHQVVGAVLCGTDGRRGYLNHLAVAHAWRRQGIGRRLAEHCITALYERGFEKCHLMVKRENAPGQAFWEGLGWVMRDDVRLMSHTSSRSANA